MILRGDWSSKQPLKIEGTFRGGWKDKWPLQIDFTGTLFWKQKLEAFFNIATSIKNGDISNNWLCSSE